MRAFKLHEANHVFFSTYPKQIGIKPFPMKWGAAEPKERGPIVVSRYASTIRKRNGNFLPHR